MGEEIPSSILFVFLGAAIFMLGYAAGYHQATEVTNKRWRNTLVEKGYARFNPQTAEWEWLSDSEHPPKGQ